MEKHEEKDNKPKERKRVETVLTGEVISTKADKTISVSVERIFQHTVYKKIVKKKKKYLVHDEHNKCKPGDVVRIKLVRPISKKKRWLLLDIVSTAPRKEEVIP
jgi:small subunit ribosomal protein S17